MIHVRRGAVLFVLVLGGLLLAALPASAHPLGNFTVNLYAGITVAPRELRITYVVDMAEIPTFQEMGRIDADGDGRAEEGERAAWANRTAGGLLGGLSLENSGQDLPLRLVSSVVAFSPGQGGLDILRLEAVFAAASPASGRLTFWDDNYPDRVGWREIVATGTDGLAVTASTVPVESVSDELRAYPEDLLSNPLSVRRASFTFGPGRQAAPAPAPGGGSATRPAGAEGPLAGLVARQDLSLAVVLLAIVAALGFGALHALGPGHGKTIAAAYLTGTGSRLRHALSVGLAVAVMHTASVLVLGAALLFAQRTFPADRVYPMTGIAAGVAAVALGGGLLVTRLRKRRAHEHGHAHDHPPLSRRGLVALAISGGLLPSPTAVLVLLAASSLGRLSLGLGVVVAFGLGLAAALTGIGALAVGARRALGNRLPAWMARAVPVAGAAVILVAGAVVSLRAVALF